MPFYEELNNSLTNIIGEKFLRNQNLCKLLYYYPETETLSFNPLSQPDIVNTREKIYMKNIFPLPKKPTAETKKEAFICITFGGGYEPEQNTGYRKVNLIIDIVVHIDCWNIRNGFRTYSILSEIDSMLNNQLTDLPIANKPYTRGFQPRDYSNYFYGVQAIYELQVNSNIVCNPKPQNLNTKKEEDVLLSNYSFLPKNLRLHENG